MSHWTNRARLWAILEGDDHHHGRRFAFALQAIIVISLTAVALETLPDLHPTTRMVLRIIELATISVFAAEYVARIYAAPSRRGYIFSVFGIIDLVAILPTLLTLVGVDYRALVALRVLRVLLLFKLLRYTRAVRRLGRAINYVLPELLVFASVAAALLYLSATAVYLFERHAQPEAFASIFHAIWWAVVTFTTVGYGDVYPVTAGGRIFTACILLLALGIVAVPTGLIASALSGNHQMDENADERDV